jgi:hypothetical protein
MSAQKTWTQEPTVARLYRTEVEVAANAVIAMHKAGLLKKGVTVREMAAAVGVSAEDLRLASVRAERVAARRLAPTAEPTRNIAPLVPLRPDSEPSLPAADRQPLPPAAYQRDLPPRRGDTSPPQVVRTLPRARKVVAEAIFAQWRVRGNLTCTRCGKPIDSGCDAVIEAAHHADRCAP